MKILFFILGSIEDRIIGWGVDNMNALLQQDLVFFGPIAEEHFYYKEKQYHIIPFHYQTTISDIFRKLPIDWFPDIIVCDVSVLNFIPDIYKCPVKTYLLGRDGWGDIIYNRGMSELFDFLSYSIIDRQEFKNLKINLMPLFGMPVSTPNQDLEIPLFNERNIDIISITNYNDSFYHQRYKLLYNFSKLNKSKLNIKYLVGLERSEIHRYYRKSKIVLDWAHTLSNRSYEAALNGCLLFSHEQNTLMSQFWVPWEEYIPYNDDNIQTLIKHYIENAEKSHKIILNMRKKFDKIPSTFGKSILTHLKLAIKEEINISDRINRAENSDKATLFHRTATSFYFNYLYNTNNYPKNWEDIYFIRINKSLTSESEDNAKILPLIEASRMAFLLARYDDVFNYINKLEKLLPNYGWIYYLKGRIYFDQNDLENSLTVLQQSINSGTYSSDLVKKYVLPFVEIGNVCDGRRVTDYMWKTAVNHNNDVQVKALMHLTYELIGDIFIRKGEEHTAIEYYTMAINIWPLPECANKLINLLVKTRQYKKVIKYSEIAMLDSPYDTRLHCFNYIGMVYSDKSEEACKDLKEHLMAIKSFKKNRKIILYRMLIRFLIFLTYVHIKPNQGFTMKVLQLHS